MSKENEGFLAAQARKKKGARGKAEEDKVHGVLAAWKDRDLEFDFDRLLDARAAGRPVPPTVADFTFCLSGRGGAIEVKSTEHSSRLSFSDFPQFPRMLRRAQAGGLCLLVVHHSADRLWRVINVLGLEQITRGSWDLSKFVSGTDVENELRAGFEWSARYSL